MSIFSAIKEVVKNIVKKQQPIKKEIKNKKSEYLKKDNIAGKIYRLNNKLRDAFNNTPIGKWNKTQGEKLRKINEGLKRDSKSENKRKTEMQEAYFKSAALTKEQRESGAPKTLEQKLARAEQSFFYQQTRALWLGGSEAMRNENIVAAMSKLSLESGRRVQNLADAVQWVKENYKDEFPTMEDIKRGKYDTEKDKDFAGEEETEEGSPIQISKKQWRALGVKI